MNSVQTTSDRMPLPSSTHASSFVAPDGSRIKLGGNYLGGNTVWSCPFVARVYGARRAFAVATSGTADRHAQRRGLGGLGVLSAHLYGTTEIALGYDSELRESMAAWRGPWHELLTHQSGPGVDPEGFTRIFDAFHITDMADGLLIAPRSSRLAMFEPFRVFKEIPGLGDLRIQRPNAADMSIPTWAGRSTPHGEMWRQPLDVDAQNGRSRKDILILATPTAIAELIPGPDDTADSSVAADFLAELDVAWLDS